MTDNDLITLALSLQSCPYIWGGKFPWTGFDCSGFCTWVLTTAGRYDGAIRNAAQLSHIPAWRTISTPDEPATGDLAFYGKDPDAPTHVMLCLGPELVIGARGGGHNCTTFLIARQLDARVRQATIRYRPDFLFVRTPRPPAK